MRLCDEIRLWNKIIPCLNPPHMRKKPRSPYKEIPFIQKDHIKITIDHHGARSIAVEKKPKEKCLKRGLFDKRGKSGKLNRTKIKDKKDMKPSSHNMGTQANRHDLEFLITDPSLNGQQLKTESDDDTTTYLYDRESEMQRQYRSRSKTLDINGQTTDNISVHLTNLKLDDPQEEDNSSSTSEQERETTTESDSNVEDDNSSEAPEPAPDPPPKEELRPVHEQHRLKMTSKPSEYKYTMIRVGGGWMELPDYLRHHVPKHVYGRHTYDDFQFVIRSQRPRTALVCKQKELPSWAATLSRASKGSAATINRYALP